MSHQTLAQQLIEVLRLAGVVRVLGVVGDSLYPVVDAIRRTDGIDWVHVRHQEVGAFAAAAEAQMPPLTRIAAGGVSVLVVPGTSCICRRPIPPLRAHRDSVRLSLTWDQGLGAVPASTREPTPSHALLHCQPAGIPE